MDIALFRFCHSKNISVSAPIYHAEFINNCAKLNDNPLHTHKNMGPQSFQFLQR